MSAQYRINFNKHGEGWVVNEEAGENLPIHNLVYRNAAGTWSLADADAAATMPVLGITMGAIAAGKKGEILLWGYIGDNDTWAWTSGEDIYASTTPGALTNVAPAGIGDVVQTVAIAIEPTLIHFMGSVGTTGTAADNTIVVRRNSGADVGTQPRLNFIEGTNISLTVADDAVNTEIDITIDVDAHATDHEPGGADEVNDIDISNTGTLLSAHAARHENGGADEIDVSDLSGELADAQPVAVSRNSGAIIGTRSELNFIEGANVTLTIADDAVNDEVDITIAAVGGGASWTATFYPAVDPDSNKGTYGTVLMADDVDVEVRHTFLIPSGITTVNTAVVVIIPDASGDLYWECSTNFAQICLNEDYQTHTDSIAANASTVTADEVECIDISAALTGATGGDLVGLEFTRLGSNALDTINDDTHYVGVYIEGE